MFQSVKAFFIAWQSNNDDRAKLQQTYIVSSLVLLIAAGIVGLMNHALGQNILMVAIISAGIFLINAVVWSLLQSAVISRTVVVRPKITPTKKK